MLTPPALAMLNSEGGSPSTSIRLGARGGSRRAVDRVDLVLFHDVARRRPVEPQLERDAPGRPDRCPGAGRIDQRGRPWSGRHEHGIGGEPPAVVETHAVATPSPRSPAGPPSRAARCAALLGQRRPCFRRRRRRDRVAGRQPDGGRPVTQRWFEARRARRVRASRGDSSGTASRWRERLRCGGVWVAIEEEQPGRLGADGEATVRRRRGPGSGSGSRGRAGRGPGRTDAGWRPRFRPDAPAPMAARSTRVTRAPRSARMAAAAQPMIPPPMTTISVRTGRA